MSRPTSIYEIEESLSPRDREDFSLFLRYPEIDFDDDTSSARSSATLTADNKDELAFSPPSVRATSEYRNSPSATESTAHETPGRVPPNKESTKFGGWNEFIHLMQKSDLPQECLQYLTSLGQTILNIGTILHSTLRPNQPSSVLRIGRWLLSSIKHSSKQVASQVEAISYLKSLVAFNVDPDEMQVWSTFQQRAQLIANNVFLPSKCEANLLESLVLLYDAYVYNPFLQLYTVDHFDKQTFNMINDIYDKLMTWLHNYKMWYQGTMQLRTQYMQPLIEQLSKSENAKEELVDFKLRISKAKVVLTKPVVAGVDPMGEQLVNNLNLSARRPGAETSSKRTKTRYKREHTL